MDRLIRILEQRLQEETLTLKEEKDLVKEIAEVKDFRKFVLGRWDNAAHERVAIALQTRAAEEAKQLAARREAAARRAEERRDGSALLARCSQSSRSSHSQTYCTSRSTSPVPGDKKKHRHLLRSYSTCRMSARSSAVPISAPSHLRLGASLRGGRPAY